MLVSTPRPRLGVPLPGSRRSGMIPGMVPRPGAVTSSTTCCSARPGR